MLFRSGPFLADLHTLSARTRTPEAELFALGTITLRTRAIHTVKPLEVRLPKGRLIAVTGVSGSGKTTLVLESLIPALEAAAKGEALPAHVESIDAPGIAQVKLFTDTTDEDWHRMMAVDLDGAFYACRAVLPGMVHQKYGRILLVSSMWGQTGGSCEVAYSAAKAGLIGLGKALAKEEGPSGITVNVIAPGVIDTDMMAGFTAEDRAALAEETPVERLGTADEIARTMVFLADEASGYITGQVLGVNGGLVI